MIDNQRNDKIQKKDKQIKLLKKRHSRLVNRMIIIGSCIFSVGGHYFIDAKHQLDDSYNEKVEKNTSIIYVIDSASYKKLSKDSKTLILKDGDIFRIMQSQQK